MFVRSERYPFKEGLPKKTVVSPFFFLRYQENSLSQNRFAVVVSKKVDTRATTRNRIKRVFIEILRSLEEKKPFDYVFFLKKDILKKNKEDIKQELMRVLLKIS